MESSNRCDEGRDRLRALVLFAAGWSAVAAAQIPQRIDPLVVTATRTEQRAFDLPVAIDSIDAEQIQRNQLQVNLSESLSRVPGIVVANRWNYAQDLQISSRGFGARANFGARGIRLYQDGIPATMPDGQGQTGSFSLVSTQRIEVLRGPFSTLYGNAAGGVISVFSEDGADPPQLQGQVVGGSYATYNAIAKTSGVARGVGYVLAANHFSTDGYRDHSEASRDLVNAKLKFDIDADTRVTLIGNSLYQPEAQDPLGLTRAQWEANPRQADPSAELFNTRKTVNQSQGGAAIERQLGAGAELRRDEDDFLSATDGYAQAQWAPLAALSFLGGARYSDVRFNSVDHYINALNPDDSGRVAYSHLSPVVGATWHAAPSVNVYAN